ANYFIIGKALISGQGFRDIHLADAPIDNTFPVVFPILLAALQIFDRSPLLCQIVMGILGALVILFTYNYFKKKDTTLIFPLLILTAASNLLATFGLIFMSEICYTLLTLLALWLLDKSLERPGNAALFWGALAVSILPANCRSIGIAFSAAWVVSTLVDKKYRYAVVHVLLTLVALLLIHLFIPWESGYQSLLFLRDSYDPGQGIITTPELVHRVLDNIGIHSTYLIASCIVPFGQHTPPFLPSLLSKIFIVLITVGWLRGFFGRGRIISFYLLFYFGIVMVWPLANDRRIVCVLPFLFYFLLRGIHVLISVFNPQTTRNFKGLLRDFIGKPKILTQRQLLMVWVLVWIIAGLNVINRIGKPGFHETLSADWINFYRCADWVRENTAPDVVVMNRKPELFYLRCNRKGIVYPYSHDVEAIVASLKQNRVAYIVYDNFFWTNTTAKYLYPVIVSHPEYFKVVYGLHNPDFFILQFVAPGGGASS
ncbi:MAG: hypothetical protein PHC61_14870, partial [Chitinivibrionales bacterium]|nr:hypothetical protein [Chitinivibrionales bacterium]